MEFITYFLVGVLLDVLGTIDTQCIIDKKPFKSAIISFMITMVWVFILSSIIVSSDKVIATISYALGGAVGSYFTVKRNRKNGGVK